MKFDLHCHTKEGSIDAKVRIEDYVKTLIQKGFDGMLVTDHNSYKGFEKWAQIQSTVTLEKPFVVLKGIEYDTSDGGHFIVILPDGVHSDLIAVRGLKTSKLVEVVHNLGGILGPAHPFDTGFYAFANTKSYKKLPELVNQFDFIETCNSCAKVLANTEAALWAMKEKKLGIAGSDSHRLEVVGSAYTEFETPVLCNNDLISTIRNGSGVTTSTPLEATMKRKVSLLTEKLGIIGYWVYNKLAVLRYVPKRKRIRKKNQKNDKNEM